MRTQFIQEQIKTPSHAAAQLAQTELDALVPTFARKDAALRMAVEAMERSVEEGCTDHLDCCDDYGEFWHKAIAACRKALGEGT